MEIINFEVFHPVGKCTYTLQGGLLFFNNVLSFLRHQFNFLFLYHLYTTPQSLLTEDGIPTTLVLIELGELLRLVGGGGGHPQEFPAIA